MSLEGFEILEPIKTRKKSVLFDKTGRITFSDGLLAELSVGENASVQLRWNIQRTDVEKKVSVPQKGDPTKTKIDKVKVPTITTKQLAFVFGNGSSGVSLRSPAVGNTRHITAPSFLERKELRQLMKGVKYRYDAVSVDKESNAVIVDLLKKGRNKVVS